MRIVTNAERKATSPKPVDKKFTITEYWRLAEDEIQQPDVSTSESDESTHHVKDLKAIE